MNKYEFTKKFTFDDNDLVDIISSAVYDIGYWACIDNGTDDWCDARNNTPDDYCFEDIFLYVLNSGKSVCLIDVEDCENVWELTLEKLLGGIQGAIDNNYWDGDIDSLDGQVGDIIFQYALFHEIVYG